MTPRRPLYPPQDAAQQRAIVGFVFAACTLVAAAAPAKSRALRPPKAMAKGAADTPPTSPKITASPKIDASAAESVTAPATPSPAAAPTPPSDADPKRLREILLSARGKPTAIGYVVDLKTGDVILDLNGGKAIYPASVSKMFSTAATLRTLPNGKPLSTRILAKRKGSAATTLAVVGSGDPSLTSAHLKKLASKVFAAGIRSVGRLVVDSSIFDSALPAGYDEKNTDASYRAPVAGFQVDNSTVTIALKSRKIGQKVEVELRPAGDAFVLINEAVTVRGRGKPIQVVSSGQGRHTKIVVRGSFGSRRRRIATRRRVHDAAFVAAAAFRQALVDTGIKVSGKTRFGAAPKGLKPLTTHHSRPLIELVKTCNQTSNNAYAESFYKLLGATKLGTPGSSAKGQKAAQQALSDLGMDFKKLRLRNGSGMYHANQVTARQVVALLTGMHKLPKVGEAWRRTLAIAGAAGTLRGRMRGAATRRRIYAKTGTLDDVTALAGYALGPKKQYAFALFYNDVKAPARIYRRVHDRFLVALLDPTAKQQQAK